MPKLFRQLIHLVFLFVEVLLILRFVLRLLGARATADWVAWIYGTSATFISPFAFAFPEPSINGRFVIEFSTLFAIFAYAVIGYIVQEVADMLLKNKK